MAEETEDTEQTEFLLVCENGDIEPFDDYHDAYEALTAAVKRDVEKYGEETAREGVIHPYGRSITVMRDGRDVTEDWERNEPHKPLGMD
ncbi:hypothetical protein [Streptomyces arenae]|uniref:hypothetical protein n=1 Tax=Streptomyces arenae TaxID=29301 RepID=UPI00265A773A|nr:hypothetical protein [Streptomyces arenae]MCG7202322.1 hypothetical protein [Streptomyces arenae]